MNNTIKQEYLKKLNKVVEYINTNLSEKITISELSKLSNISPFHFHRIMKSLLGEPIGNYITRTKVERASVLIRYTNMEFQDIAYQLGYENPSSLNRIFKKYYKISPTEYRNNLSIKLNKSAEEKISITLPEPEIITLSEKNIIYFHTKGAYEKDNINTAWNKLIKYAERINLFYSETEYYGISYDDPSVTAPEMCRYEACITIKNSFSQKGEFGVKTIKGGKFAVFKYIGPYENWGAAYDYIFDNWLLKSNYYLRNIPIMEKYINQNDDSILNIEIYLPIKKCS